MLHRLKGYLSPKAENEIVGIASTETADRDGEIIKQSGWDLENFKSNPVILASHNYHNFPIGKATDIAIENGKLMFKMVFSQATEEAKQAYQLVKEGILNTFSVGFIPREYDAKDQNVITRAELLEISLVSVPANPQAIVMAKGYKENSMAQELIKQWLLDEKVKGEVEQIEKEEEEKNVPQEVEVTEGKELECECGKKFILKVASQVGDDEPKGEEGEGVDEKELDVTLIKKVTGHLQELLAEQKKKGGVQK
jgi:HK97 family phage prohead protease